MVSSQSLGKGGLSNPKLVIAALVWAPEEQPQTRIQVQVVYFGGKRETGREVEK